MYVKDMNLLNFNKAKPKKILFNPFNEWVRASETKPVPSFSIMPSWYKQLRRFVNNSDFPIKAHGKPDVKMCSPFREAITYGYLLVTPCELEVTWMADGTPEISWNPQFPYDPIHLRGDVRNPENQGLGMSIPAGCSPFMFALSPMWAPETPKGYSVLITHPLNRHELPFILTSGIMDSDKWTDAGNMPFFIKSDFVGVIPKGTPIAQIIPLKRDDWESEYMIENSTRNSHRVALRDSFFYGYYHRFIRVKKSFK
jgi:hypothetical protein